MLCNPHDVTHVLDVLFSGFLTTWLAICWRTTNPWLVMGVFFLILLVGEAVSYVGREFVG